jgi:hypothetical protein
MATNNSADDVMRAGSHSYGEVLLWVCGSSAAVFVSEQAIRWGLETLRTQFLAMLSAALLSAMPVLQPPAGQPSAAIEFSSDVVPASIESNASIAIRDSGSYVAQTVRDSPNK